MLSNYFRNLPHSIRPVVLLTFSLVNEGTIDKPWNTFSVHKKLTTDVSCLTSISLLDYKKKKCDVTVLSNVNKDSIFIAL